MKRIVLLAGLTSLLFSCTPQHGYKIVGSLKNIPDNTVLYLKYRLNGENFTDSTYVVDNKFVFSDTVETPFRAQIEKGDAKLLGRNLDYVTFYVEKGLIKMESPDSLRNVVITGSALNDEDRNWKAIKQTITDARQALIEHYYSTDENMRDTEEFKKHYEALSDSISAKEKQLAEDYINEHPSSFIGLDQLFFNLVGYNPDAAKAEELFNRFSPELRESPAGKEIAEQIEEWRKTSVGYPAPEFTQDDPDGKPVSLKDFRGKYLLLDFWASWCGPCRNENPNVVKAYNRFKNRNFTILGVSLDNGERNGRERWLKAIKDDNLTWTHVSDLKYWNNEVSRLYGIQAIPANFLIDPDGIIIGKDLRGVKLTEKLEEVLGE
ncbi:MAG: AhpC/TSA family protein [Tannerella sp.]|jgi:peroxiredoxin|nr:AhpC/TSA family protein [Tannerella sp.]